MTDEQIKQNAEAYAKKIYHYTVGKAAAIRDFIAGAHSRDEEIEELQNELESLRKGFYERGDKLKELIKKLMLANNKLRNDNKDLEQALACAEDVVDIQRKELDKLRNPWISVEERLPEKEDGRFDMSAEVLVRTEDYPKYIVAAYDHRYNRWWATYELEKVTHWQPIKFIQQ